MTIVLGLNVYAHDSGCCLYVDGKLIVAIETERLTRVKHDQSVFKAIDYVRNLYPSEFDNIDLVALSLLGDYQPYQDWVDHRDITQALSSFARGQLSYRTRCNLRGRMLDCVLVAHEASHAALALHAANFNQPSFVLVNEGGGTFSGCSLFEYSNGQLTLLEQDMLPWYATGRGWEGLGALVLKLGDSLSAPGKAMALGAFGQATEADRNLLLGIPSDIVRLPEEKRIQFIAKIVDYLNQKPDVQGVGNLVATFQDLFTTGVSEYLRSRLPSSDTHLAMAGGCALNVLTNSYLRQHVTPNLFIPPACNDSGQSLGAAIYVLKLCCGVNPEPVSAFSNGIEILPGGCDEIARNSGYECSNFDPMRVAYRLSEGAVVAWARGRAEVGPRALGHRSLLANPCVPGMREHVSEHIKGREWFRPLAPVMELARFRSHFPDQQDSPHMLFSYDVPNELFPEATHVDNTARIQTVSAEENPSLCAVLGEFERLSGVPALINTSLNGAGKAIAYTAEHVFDDFLRSAVDVFVMGDQVYTRMEPLKFPGDEQKHLPRIYPWRQNA